MYPGDDGPEGPPERELFEDPGDVRQVVEALSALLEPLFAWSARSPSPEELESSFDPERARLAIEDAARGAGMQDLVWLGPAHLHGVRPHMHITWQTLRYPAGNHSRMKLLLDAHIPMSVTFDTENPRGRTDPKRIRVPKSARGPAFTVVAPPHIQQSVHDLAARGRVQLGGNVLTLERYGGMLSSAPWLARGVGLAGMILEAWNTRAAHLQRLGFSAARAAASENNAYVGIVDGVQVWVTEGCDPSGRFTVHTRAKLDPSFPPETWILPKTAGGEPIGDLVLDHALVLRSSDLDTARARLRHQELHAPLLELVHGHPGSSVTSHTVELVRPGPIHGDCGVLLVAELVNGLGHPPGT